MPNHYPIDLVNVFFVGLLWGSLQWGILAGESLVPPKEGVWGPATDGLKVSLVLGQHSVRVGTPLPFAVSVQNVTAGVRDCEFAPLYHLFQIRANRGAGMPVDSTSLWRSGGPGSRHYWKAGPGGGYGVQFADLTQLVDMSLPGQYVVEIGARICSAEEPGEYVFACSNREIVEVIAPQAYHIIEDPVVVVAEGLAGVPRDFWGETSSGLRLSLTVKKRSVTIGDDVACDVVLQNIGESVRFVPFTNLLSDGHSVSVIRRPQNSAGAFPVRLTALGQLTFSGIEKRKALEGKLRPGEGYRSTIFALNRLFDMTYTCTTSYEIQVMVAVPAIEGGEPVLVRSNPVMISVSAPLNLGQRFWASTKSRDPVQEPAKKE